ncbi:nucleotide exchange factor GrpE [Flavobacteriales bacterium]|jgi:molecular chaperone GrpE|nr:nucleotide exchange factor GrpE [Flavobacteriales bacterium]MDB4195710.1 nucleotide exchange factor GrpE [Flavobacteriales bacterium]|tara:strand:+ start:6980 stop:7600 length:621 start_codon:yes stop_codon:yes gene_type:complete
MANKLKMFNRNNNRGKMTSENENNEEFKEENATEETAQNPEASQEENQEESAPVIEKSELELAQEAVLLANDKYLRLYSEFDNFRKRTAKEKLDTIKSASEDVIKNMLPIVDDFKRAMAHNLEVNDADAIKQGFELIYNKLFNSLETKGLKKIEAMGEVFNADIHEAITNIPAASEDMKGKIMDVVEEGYYLGDKIIRFPKVVIGQ